MDAQNKDDKVKLVFDIMPQEDRASFDRAAESRAYHAPEPQSAVTPPSYAPAAEPGYTGNAAPESQKKFGFKIPPIVLTWWFLSSVGVVILAVAAYFLFDTFFPKDSGEPIEVPEQVVQEPQLTVAWLLKNFGAESCAALDLCGPQADPDQDGLNNLDEEKYGTNPKSSDSDFDGLADLDEIQIYSTDPVVVDSDGDGFEDGLELRGKYSPLANSQYKMSAVEEQQIQDNITKLGQHEPTIIFLTMVSYKTKFFPSVSTTPQLSFSILPSWTISETENIVTFTAPVATDAAYVRIKSLSTTPTTTIQELYQNFQKAAEGKAGYQLLNSSESQMDNTAAMSYEYTYTQDATSVWAEEIVFKKGTNFYHLMISSATPAKTQYFQTFEIMLRSVR